MGVSFRESRWARASIRRAVLSSDFAVSQVRSEVRDASTRLGFELPRNLVYIAVHCM